MMTSGALDGNSQGNDVALFLYYLKLQSKASVHRAQYPLSVPPKTPLLLLADIATICHYYSIIWRGRQKSSHQRRPEI